MDFRRPEYRREVWHRFYEFHLKFKAHPGCVYFLMRELRDELHWTEEQALWFAFINGNTQNPVTSLIIHRRFPEPSAAAEMLEWFDGERNRLAWDTDRRYHRKAFGDATFGYLDRVVGSEQGDAWRRAASLGWRATWDMARRIPTFGRLSAFSYTEYLRIMGMPIVCEDLMLGDLDGSRSHRNGLSIVLGRDEWDWHASNPEFDRYTPGQIRYLTDEAAELLAEAHERAQGKPWEHDVGYFTMESALCTYKSWHRPNRRYPNVYADMLRDRIEAAQREWPNEDLGPLWRARERALPEYLRLEATPSDPGCVPEKQNHYRETGQVVMMHREWECFGNEFNDRIEAR